MKKWIESSMATKLATIGTALAGITTIIIGFGILDELQELLSFLDALGIELGLMLTILILVYGGIDILVAVGLFFVKRWARGWAIWLGIVGIINIIPNFTSDEIVVPWLIPNILLALGGIFALFARKDFKKPKAD